jgi:hypothetical protein
MKRKKTRKEKWTRKEINYKQQKEKLIGRYNERNELINLGQQEEMQFRSILAHRQSTLRRQSPTATLST